MKKFPAKKKWILDDLEESSTDEERSFKRRSCYLNENFVFRASRLDFLDDGSASSTAEERKAKMRSSKYEIWPEPESNWRHKDFQSSALP
ncbi:MAG: hypothetical protein WAM28_05265, partial [Chlamydiales bacterium]